MLIFVCCSISAWAKNDERDYNLVVEARRKFPKLEFTEADNALLQGVQRGDAVVCKSERWPSHSGIDVGADNRFSSPCRLSEEATAVEFELVPQYLKADGKDQDDEYVDRLAMSQDQRTVHAALIRWLAVDPEAVKHIDPRGIFLIGARVDRNLDLSFAKVPFPLTLRWCDIEGGLVLQGTAIPRLNLEHSHVKGIMANSFNDPRGVVFLRNGFKSSGGINFVDAEVRNFDCGLSEFDNPDGFSLRLGDAHISYLNLSDSIFHGQVSLENTVMGSVDSGGAEFYPATLPTDSSSEVPQKPKAPLLASVLRPDEAVSLSADSARIDGDATLSPITAHGSIDLTSIKVAGSLTISGTITSDYIRQPKAKDSPSTRDAVLVLDTADVGHNLSIDGQLITNGTISMVGANVDNDLDIERVTFEDFKDFPTGLRAEATTVHRRFFFEDNKPGSNMTLDLTGSSMSSVSMGNDDWSAAKWLYLDNFVYDHIELNYENNQDDAQSKDIATLSKNATTGATFLRWLQKGDASERDNAPAASYQFHPQPYREVAKFLEEEGNDIDARFIMETKEKRVIDEYEGKIARPLMGLILIVGVVGVLLRKQAINLFANPMVQKLLRLLAVATALILIINAPMREFVFDMTQWALIGFGYFPFFALIWSIAIVLFGWLVVYLANEAGLMKPVPHKEDEERKNGLAAEKVTNSAAADLSEPLSPFLYSVNIFLPIVDLHQEKHWWPDARNNAKGEFEVRGRKFTLYGYWIREYLWFQIIAGWILGGFFLAGLSGLIKHP
jgi:hypothetical protein